MKKVTIHVPCYNEEGNVRLMAEKIREVMRTLDYDYEILFVDNCSTDNTRNILRTLAKEDKRIKLVLNNRNYGTIDERSSRNALKHATGDFFVSLACDFQDPPELIPEMIKAHEEGYKIAFGQKVDSEEIKGKYLLRQLFYNIIDDLSGKKHFRNISSLGMVDSEIFKKILETDIDYLARYSYEDMGLIPKIIPYKQKKRASGKSSYNLSRSLDHSITVMTNTSTKPLRLMTVFGFFSSVISFLLAIVFLIMKFVYWDRYSAGMIPVLLTVLFIGSVLLLGIGMLGEYMAAILRKIEKRPDVISEYVNIEGEIDN